MISESIELHRVQPKREENNHMRATYHFGRVRKDGAVYSSKHNDRNYESANTVPFPEKTKDNLYYQLYKDKGENLTFEEAEKKFYEENFSEKILLQNRKNEKAGHKERNKSIDDLLQSPKTCPEEIIIQVGNSDSHIDKKTLTNVINEQFHWLRKEYPNFQILDMAIHMDEYTPHAHVRGVWIAHDKNGHAYPSQTGAFKEMGLEAPNSARKRDRFNNPKQIYTERSRANFEAICRNHGIDITTDRLEASEVGLEQLEYKRRREAKKLEQIEENVNKIAPIWDNMKKEGAEMFGKALSVMGKKEVVEDIADRLDVNLDDYDIEL